MRRRRLLAAALLLLGGTASAGYSGEQIRIGLLVDLESIYADLTGKGSVLAARMAIEDFAGRSELPPVELVVKHHKNDPALAAEIARRWLDEDGVDFIAEVVGSPPALAVQEVARPRRALVALQAVVTTAVTNEACAPNSFHWMYDAYGSARLIGGIIARRGAKRWYTLTVDNAYGDNFIANLASALAANGGEIIGGAKHPLNTPRFIRYLLDAEASGADVLALGNAGADVINSIKQSYDLLRVSKGEMVVTAPSVTISTIHGAGLALTQGMLLPSAFYWDYDNRSRTWARRFYARHGAMPNEPQAGVYSAVTHYLKAVSQVGGDAPDRVAARMRELPVDDPVVRNGRLRADGRLVHDLYLVRVKKPTESQQPWDYFEVLETVPGEQAFQPLADSRCPLLKD